MNASDASTERLDLVGDRDSPEHIALEHLDSNEPCEPSLSDEDRRRVTYLHNESWNKFLIFQDEFIIHHRIFCV
jgi:hypothetical protein